MAVTGGELLGRCLSQAGVRTVWGDPPCEISHVGVVPVADPGLASLLADADGRMAWVRPGVAMTRDGRMRLSCRPGGHGPEQKVASVQELPHAVADAAREAASGVPGTACLALDFDLGSPVDGATETQTSPPAASGSAADISGTYDELARILDGSTSPMIFAGPGVLGRAVDELRALAGKANLGVSNTWGAKGVFAWNSEHHLGTVGLQARDFELGGFAEADLIVSVGLDPDESPFERWSLAPSVDLSVRDVAEASRRLARSRTEEILRTRLFEALSSVVQPLYASDAFPMAPPRVIADIAASMSPGDRLVADPGLAGFWVARAFPTSEIGSVVVPATRAQGFAAAAALVVALVDRPPLAPIAVTTSPVDEVTESIVELARRLDAPIVVEAWGPDGELRTARGHLGALETARSEKGARLLQVQVDDSFIEPLLAAAGDVVAWGGLRPAETGAKHSRQET